MNPARGNVGRPHPAQKLLHARAVQPLERDVVKARVATHLTDQVAQRGVEIQLDIAIGHHDEQGHRHQVAGQVLQQLQAGGVCPVQIVQHEQPGTGIGGARHELGEGVHEPMALLLRVERGKHGQLW
jgi:hypothetical protein